MEPTADIIAAAVAKALAEAEEARRAKLNETHIKYYHKKKGDPDFEARLKQERARYYQKYRDRIKAKNLQAYYDAKAKPNSDPVPA